MNHALAEASGAMASGGLRDFYEGLAAWECGCQDGQNGIRRAYDDPRFQDDYDDGNRRGLGIRFTLMAGEQPSLCGND